MNFRDPTGLADSWTQTGTTAAGYPTMHYNGWVNSSNYTTTAPVSNGNGYSASVREDGMLIISGSGNWYGDGSKELVDVVANAYAKTQWAAHKGNTSRKTEGITNSNGNPDTGIPRDSDYGITNSFGWMIDGAALGMEGSIALMISTGAMGNVALQLTVAGGADLITLPIKTIMNYLTYGAAALTFSMITNAPSVVDLADKGTIVGGVGGNTVLLGGYYVTTTSSRTGLTYHGLMIVGGAGLVSSYGALPVIMGVQVTNTVTLAQGNIIDALAKWGIHVPETSLWGNYI